MKSMIMAGILALLKNSVLSVGSWCVVLNGRMTMKCINCGAEIYGDVPQVSWVVLCDACNEALDQLEQALENGIELKYDDGTTTVIRSNKGD
jgi:hypothetical protein